MKSVRREKGFLGLTDNQVVNANAMPVYIIPFGNEYDEGYGCGKAAEAIIKASREINLFDERLGCYPYQQMNLTTLKEISSTKSQKQAIEQMQKFQRQLIANHQMALTLGGDHRLIPKLISPWLSQKNEIVFIHLGAHGTVLNDLAHLYPQNEFVGLGLRSISEALFELQRREKNRVLLYYAADKTTWDWSRLAALLRNKTAFLSFSVDCFDMSLLPATPWAEPGGLFWDDALFTIESLTKLTNIAGACVCDFAPLDYQMSYDLLVAKLVYRMLATLVLFPKS